MSKRTLRALVLALPLIVSLQAAKLPRPVPPFSINLSDGREFPLAAQKGKVVALCFILTTCPHCQNYSRILNKMQSEFGSQGVQVVASAIEETAKAAVPGFIRAYAPSYPVGYNDFVLVGDFLEQPRAVSLKMPVMVFIDRKGTILAQYQAGDPFMENNPEGNLRQMLQGIVKGTITAETVAKEEAKKKINTSMPAAPGAKAGDLGKGPIYKK